MNDVTFGILKVVISVCASLITIYVVPYLYALQKNEKYAQLIDVISNAVRAAEQVVKGTGMGTVKKERVMQFVREWLGKQGLTLTDEQISELTEAAVYGMKQEAK